MQDFASQSAYCNALKIYIMILTKIINLSVKENHTTPEEVP